jgi:hypothetical protein
MSIPDNAIINDIRASTVFKGTTFSNYKLSEVKKQLIDNMNKNKIEPACYWSIELICSGHYGELWECILLFVGKYIHIGNPKIIMYLEKRYEIFKNIVNQRHYNLEIDLRNNLTIRNIFAEIITILCQSNKKPSFETLKINRVEEFDMTIIKDRFKAKDTSYALTVFDKDDPKELFISINEFAYHIGGPKPNMREACYWIEWIIEFDIICRKRKQKCLCKRRTYDVDTKFQCDSIWIIWEVLLYYCEKKNNNSFLMPIMTSLKKMFSAKYSLGTSKKRKYLLYFAIELLTEYVPTNIELIGNKDTVKNVIEKISEIYKQIKKNEVSPKTEYLFNNLKKENNLENSIKKLNMIENMDFVPRTGD